MCCYDSAIGGGGIKKSKRSRGLRFLVETGWDRHYPEIQALVGTPQDPEWHPEGDVFVHTCHCLDALVTVPAWLEAERETRIVLTLAVLGHDFAKPQTTHVAVRHEQLRIVSPGHEAAGGDVTARFLDRIRTPLAIRERVVPLVMNHLAHMHMQTDRMVRRLSKRLEPATITELIVVITADQFGRPPRPRALTENVLELQKRATDLQVQFHAPDPILLGRHLIEKGMKPGPEFSVILSAAYEAQLEGQFFTLHEAWRWLAAEAALPVPDAVREKLPAAGTAAS